MISYLPDLRHSETESSGFCQEANFELEEILQSELGSLVASGFSAFFVFVFVDCTDTSSDPVVDHTLAVVVAEQAGDVVVNETVVVVPSVAVVDIVVELAVVVAEEAVVLVDETVVFVV